MRHRKGRYGDRVRTVYDFEDQLVRRLEEDLNVWLSRGSTRLHHLCRSRADCDENRWIARRLLVQLQ